MTPQFQVRQCTQITCHFRFPVSPTERPGDSCPRCAALTEVVYDWSAVPEATAVSTTSPPIPPTPRLTALLDNIRSIHNVGSIFRSADGAGVHHLYLCGMTATPQHAKLAKAALGAQETVGWSYHLNGWETAVALHQAGYELWAIESTPQAEPFLTVRPTLAQAPVVLIVGNEKAGIDPGILTLCQRVFSLPMGGQKRSLNVAVAFGIAAYGVRYGHNAAGDAASPACRRPLVSTGSTNFAVV